MLLAVDVGNTNITCGIFRGSRIIKRFSIPTAKYTLSGLRRGLGRACLGDAVISSVVPAATGALEKDLRVLLGKGPYILGKNIVVPIKNLYRRPKQVGSDRLVNAYAGIRLYGAPLIVVDLGTAVTIDVVSAKGAYLGGMILPGMKISLKALHQYTALLPQIKLAKPREFIGGDTKSSMLSGLVYGAAALIDDLTRSIKHKIGRKARVIGTGGDIRLIAQYADSFDSIDPDLTLKGLHLLYQDQGHRE